MTREDLPEPPAHLSQRAQQIWCQVVHGAISPGRRVYLQVALEALDRADQAGREVDEQGLATTTKTTGAVHANPLLRIERENRVLFARLWDRLALFWDPMIDGGPVNLEKYKFE